MQVALSLMPLAEESPPKCTPWSNAPLRKWKLATGSLKKGEKKTK
jgi:hypothetical protein